MKPETLARWREAEEKTTEQGVVYLEQAQPRNIRQIKDWLKNMHSNGYLTRRDRKRGEWLHSLSNEGALLLEELGELEHTRPASTTSSKAVPLAGVVIGSETARLGSLRTAPFMYPFNLHEWSA